MKSIFYTSCNRSLRVNSAPLMTLVSELELTLYVQGKSPTSMIVIVYGQHSQYLWMLTEELYLLQDVYLLE